MNKTDQMNERENEKGAFSWLYVILGISLIVNAYSIATRNHVETQTPVREQTAWIFEIQGTDVQPGVTKAKTLMDAGYEILGAEKQWKSKIPSQTLATAQIQTADTKEPFATVTFVNSGKWSRKLMDCDIWGIEIVKEKADHAGVTDVRMQGRPLDDQLIDTMIKKEEAYRLEASGKWTGTQSVDSVEWRDYRNGVKMSKDSETGHLILVQSWYRMPINYDSHYFWAKPHKEPDELTLLKADSVRLIPNEEIRYALQTWDESVEEDAELPLDMWSARRFVAQKISGIPTDHVFIEEIEEDGQTLYHAFANRDGMVYECKVDPKTGEFLEWNEIPEEEFAGKNAAETGETAE